MFGIEAQDLFLISFLAFLEGILSIDNALVLALMARHLPPKLQKRALTYGLVGAIFFRLGSLALIRHLLQWHWIKFIGGGYLIFISLKHIWEKHRVKKEEIDKKKKSIKSASANFWKTVLLIELMDIAFAVDSILAAVALTDKFWIIFVGGMIGVVLMRFAATGFLKLLDRFPGLEETAFLLIFVIGVKVILEGLEISGLDFHSPSAWPFWVFWGLMALCIVYGLKRKPSSHSSSGNQPQKHSPSPGRSPPN